MLGASISPSIVIHSFFLWLISHTEWVFFDGIFMRKIVEGLDQGVGFAPIFRFIILSGIFFCACSVYSNYVENVVYPLQTNRLFGGIYKKLYEKAKNVELRCYEDADFYNRYTMAMDGAEEKITAIIRGVLGTVIGAVSAVVVFWFMYEIDHYAILFIISPLLGNFLFGNLMNKYTFKRYQEQAPNEKVLNYVSRMMYLPDGAKEIRLSNVFNLFKKQYHEATQNNIKVAKKYAFTIANYNFWRITFTFTVIFEGVLIYAIYRNQVTGTISLAQLTIMTSLMVAMTWILIRVFENIMEILKHGMFVNNLRTFLEYKEEIPEDQDGDMPDREFSSLEFRNVSFSYKDEETIKDLSFVISKGQTAALVGHNGAGKTTIIKLLLRLYDPTAGTIYYNGKDIREYNLRAYRELFATTFQDFQMFGMTVKENVLMGRHYENEDTLVVDALKKAGVYDKVMTLKGGLDAIMTKEFDEEGAVLSGGESQRIKLAYFLSMTDSGTRSKPQRILFIFDEPTTGLHFYDVEKLLKSFDALLAKGHSIVVVEHNMDVIKAADWVIDLGPEAGDGGGNLVFAGKPEDLKDCALSHTARYLQED